MSNYNQNDSEEVQEESSFLSTIKNNKIFFWTIIIVFIWWVFLFTNYSKSSSWHKETRQETINRVTTTQKTVIFKQAKDYFIKLTSKNTVTYDLAISQTATDIYNLNKALVTQDEIKKYLESEFKDIHNKELEQKQIEVKQLETTTDLQKLYALSNYTRLVEVGEKMSFIEIKKYWPDYYKYMSLWYSSLWNVDKSNEMLKKWVDSLASNTTTLGITQVNSNDLSIIWVTNKLDEIEKKIVSLKQDSVKNQIELQSLYVTLRDRSEEWKKVDESNYIYYMYIWDSYVFEKKYFMSSLNYKKALALYNTPLVQEKKLISDYQLSTSSKDKEILLKKIDQLFVDWFIKIEIVTTYFDFLHDIWKDTEYIQKNTQVIKMITDYFKWKTEESNLQKLFSSIWTSSVSTEVSKVK